MKDETWADEPVASAAQLACRDAESGRTEKRLAKITCFRCDGQNHLASYCQGQRKETSNYRGSNNVDADGATN